MSRIAPLEPPYAPEIQQQFDRIMRGAPPLLLFRTIAGQPRAWEKFRAGSLLDRGPLSLREREIVIIAPARARDANMNGACMSRPSPWPRISPTSRSAPRCSAKPPHRAGRMPSRR